MPQIERGNKTPRKKLQLDPETGKWREADTKSQEGGGKPRDERRIKFHPTALPTGRELRTTEKSIGPSIKTTRVERQAWLKKQLDEDRAAERLPPLKVKRGSSKRNS